MMKISDNGFNNISFIIGNKTLLEWNWVFPKV